MTHQNPSPKRRTALCILWRVAEIIPTLRVTEDFEGTEALLRAELAEGWQEPKGERE